MLTATFNPQMAAWGHSPFAVEVEGHLIRHLAAQFGYHRDSTSGTFASGGAEANHTAVLTALTFKFPQYTRRGLRALAKGPVMYVSSESHHSFIKAARSSGLGTDAVRTIPVDEALQMDMSALQSQIKQDRRDGFEPFLVVGTAGTTNAGVIDPLPQIAEVAAQEGLWFHVDAAWGGAAALVPELRPTLDGVERSDSLTFDAHKWLSVPMAAGIFLTQHKDILARTFRITVAYVPADGAGMDIVDPYTHSIQWSRRFIGLKVFLSLAVAGWQGYAAALRHQTAMGENLREMLEQAGWAVLNQTRLPVICFVNKQHPEGRSGAYIEAIAQKVVSSGKAWVSVTRLREVQPVLRACVTSYRATPEDLQALINVLEEARQQVAEED